MFDSRSRVAISPAPRDTGAGWVLDAVFPNGKQAAIAGFNTESEAHGWLGSARHVAWLRDTRTVFSVRLVVAFLECLYSYAAVLTAVASGTIESPRQRWSALMPALEHDDFSSNRHPALTSSWNMIFFRKPVSTFRDHALGGAGQIHAALAQLRARSPACVVFDALERAGKEWSYRPSRSTFWHRTLY